MLRASEIEKKQNQGQRVQKRQLLAYAITYEVTPLRMCGVRFSTAGRYCSVMFHRRSASMPVPKAKLSMSSTMKLKVTELPESFKPSDGLCMPIFLS